jgi:hypothetical protein
MDVSARTLPSASSASVARGAEVAPVRPRRTLHPSAVHLTGRARVANATTTSSA